MSGLDRFHIILMRRQAQESVGLESRQIPPLCPAANPAWGQCHRPSRPAQMPGNEACQRTGMHEEAGTVAPAHVPQNDLQPALDAGLIERTQPDKPNSRLQRQRRLVRSATPLNALIARATLDFLLLKKKYYLLFVQL